MGIDVFIFIFVVDVELNLIGSRGMHCDDDIKNI